MRTLNQEHKRLIESNVNYCLKSSRAGFLGSLASTSASFLGIILIVGIIFTSQALWHTPPVILISFLYLLVRFIQNLSASTNYFGILNANYPQMSIALEYFNKFEVGERSYATLPSDSTVFFGSRKNYNLPENYFNQQKYPEIKNENIEKILPLIQFNKVSFAYPNKHFFILKDFSFNIKPGEQIGIIGPSGSGKSTLLMLLLGILKPISGEILISNQIPSLYFSYLSSKIGYVGPEPFLIRGTIRENLLYGIRDEVSESQIWQALEFASVRPFVESLTLDYFIAEDQSGLSAGQKQRLCLARAFLNQPQLLVLDEATSNLDEATESDIALTIEKLKSYCTTIIVSHRPGILKSVDKIIDMNSMHD